MSTREQFLATVRRVVRGSGRRAMFKKNVRTLDIIQRRVNGDGIDFN
jgi:hypothetical protein